VYAFELSNGKQSTPLTQQTQQPVAEPVQEITPEPIVDIENNTDTPPEEVTEEYIRTDQVIKLNLDLAQIGVCIGLVIIVMGIIACMRIPNPYNLPSLIVISENKKKYYRKYKAKKFTESRIPCKGDIGAMYLLAIQSGLMDVIEEYLSDKELLSSTDLLVQNGSLKKIATQKKVKIYKLTKFGEQDVIEIIHYMNYLSFADRNNTLRQEDLQYYELFGDALKD
jgi:hypothetical protein